MTGLNEEQRRIAETKDGIMVVDAGPGTGKTHTITERYVNLIKANVSPADILMVTFTINAAEEMRGRIRSGLIKAAIVILAVLLQYHDKRWNTCAKEYISR